MERSRRGVPGSASGWVVVGGRCGRGDLEVEVELRSKLCRAEPANPCLNGPVFQGLWDRVHGYFQVIKDFSDDFDVRCQRLHISFTIRRCASG